MAYKIYNIQDFDARDRDLYFLDSNVWIWYLSSQQLGEDSLKEPWQRRYAEFLSTIVLLNLDTSPNTPKPKIVINSLLFSELTNAYMRGVMNAYIDDMSFTDDEKKRYNFKQFRKTLEYKDQLRDLKSTFQQMSAFLHFIDDEFKSMKPLELLDKLSNKYDFNDFYYYSLFKGKNIVIVTGDSDFEFENIEIITNRPSLLAKSNL